MSSICPYPGLRPFNEEESIFFRGREEHIEKIISQLEEKKFVMLTGASGDGKSSIVYAGVIPNARAGFFKAKFNNWLIADFRPERSPLKNLAIALSDKLGYNDVAFVEKELGFGFSSLIKLYKNSPFYIDNTSEEWNKADEAERKKLKRKAANLFILVDQFEEFFTNSENYNNGKASVNSQTVANLLLETAKIALAEDLPIYIICTMRSDYIGQCAAFRGLPEYIGFSQFFVPRLKRKEIHQVIEEPALLNGNTISNRLTETLINELGEGFDQLPVLQHALNQVWNQAEKGGKEMDLIHLAMIGGLQVSQLREEEQKKFNLWLTKEFLKDSANKISSDEVKDEKNKTSLLLQLLPDFQKKFFANPSLENVLNSHANELFQTAFEYYNSNHEEKISKEDACAIIKTTFQCLTKIDDSRAVRNRMTLEEITNIINRPEITSEIVGDVLDIFRLQGNTFLKPFVTHQPESFKLKQESVIDITHESLIRNWSLLEEWAKEEYDNWLNFQDFNKQLQRWINSGKEKGYLLPIGPLTFFENWHNTCKPNKYWLARYDESDSSKEEKLAKAELTLLNAELFIKRSARKLYFSRYVLKHGAGRITAVFGIIGLIILCSYYSYDYYSKQNDYVVEDIKQKGLELLSSVKANNETKADFLIKNERLEPGSFSDALNIINNDTMSFDIAYDMFISVQNFEKKEETRDESNPLVYPLLSYMSERLSTLTNQERISFTKTHKINLSRTNKYLSLCAYVKSYDNSDTINRLIDKHSWVLNKILTGMFELPSDSVHFNEDQFNNSIQLLLAIAPQTDFKYYRNKLSCIENNPEAKKRFNKIYPHDKNNNPYDGYQILAYLYATDTANNSISKINECVDSIVSIFKDYSRSTEYSFVDILNTLSLYNNYTTVKAGTLLNEYYKITESNDIATLNKTIASTFNNRIPFLKISGNFSNNYFVKYFLTNKQRENIWNNYISIFGSFKNKSFASGDIYRDLAQSKKQFTTEDFNFYSAMYYKKRGTYCVVILNNQNESDNYFSKAFDFYNSLSEEYLNSTGKELLGLTENWDLHLYKRSNIFLFPKILNEEPYSYLHKGESFSTWSPQIFGNEQSHTSPFFDYVIKNKLTKYYANNDGINYLTEFADNYLNEDFKQDKNFYSIHDLINELGEKGATLKNNINSEFFAMVEINKAFENHDTTLALKLVSKLDWIKLKDKVSFGDNITSAITFHLAECGELAESFKFINKINIPYRKRNRLIQIAYNLQTRGPVENTCVYLDSFFKNNDIDGQPKFGNKLICVLGMIGSQYTFDLAMKLTKDVPEIIKSNAMNNFIKGVAFNGFYYKAEKDIPVTVSTNKQLQLYNIILQTEIENRKKDKTKLISKGWNYYDEKADTSGDGDYEGDTDYNSN